MSAEGRSIESTYCCRQQQLMSFVSTNLSDKTIESRCLLRKTRVEVYGFDEELDRRLFGKLTEFFLLRHLCGGLREKVRVQTFWRQVLWSFHSHPHNSSSLQLKLGREMRSFALGPRVA